MAISKQSIKIDEMMSKISAAKRSPSPPTTVIEMKTEDTPPIDNTQAIIAKIFKRPLVTVILYSMHFRMAMYLSHAIIVKCKNEQKYRIYENKKITKSNVQNCCSVSIRWGSNSPIIADKGILIPPTRRSETAILLNKILEGLCSSLFFVIVIITDRFKRNAVGERTE